MIRNRLADCVLFFFNAGIVRTHDSLKLWKRLYDVRAQIRFAQARCTTHGFYIRIYAPGHVSSQFLNPLDAFKQGAQFAVKNHPA